MIDKSFYVEQIENLKFDTEIVIEALKTELSSNTPSEPRIERLINKASDLFTSIKWNKKSLEELETAQSEQGEKK